MRIITDKNIINTLNHKFLQYFSVDSSTNSILILKKHIIISELLEDVFRTSSFWDILKGKFEFKSSEFYISSLYPGNSVFELNLKSDAFTQYAAVLNLPNLVPEVKEIFNDNIGLGTKFEKIYIISKMFDWGAFSDRYNETCKVFEFY